MNGRSGAGEWVTDMGSKTLPISREQDPDEGYVVDDAERASILGELEAVLTSTVFQTSKRCKQFLSYVVHHRLEGNHERLKERTIGVELFGRPVGYSTGDDPVVRVQAGEVRRRLEQYYHAQTHRPAVRIELHTGSYVPEFRWAQDALGREESASESSPGSHVQETPHAAPGRQHQPVPSLPSTEKTLPGNTKKRAWLLPVFGLALLAALALIWMSVNRATAPKSSLEEFWSPAFSSTEPVLICIAKPTVYMPSAKLFQRHSKTPGTPTTLFERLTQSPNLQPNDKLVWSDMDEYPDYGLAAGDVLAAIQLSGLLAKIGKKNQLRIGDGYSFEDLRNFPAVVIGAYNNRSTMQVTSNLHFAFIEEDGKSVIREQGPSGRHWTAKSGARNSGSDDYGVVTRLLDSKTGKFVVAVAGIQSYGTAAAGELISNTEYLEKALRMAPPDWSRKNLQIVLQTTVTDSVAGPPQAVAIYTW